MEIIEYFTDSNQEHWLSEIKKCDWDGGKYLHELLSTGKFKDTVGAASLLFLLVDGEKLVSFCTYSTFDDVQPTELSPWIGFVYTFPEYRGKCLMGKLFERIEAIATRMGKEYVYISTSENGLYEKYGYEFFKMLKDVHGEDSRIYRKNLSAENPEKEVRLEKGTEYKDAIVKAAKSACKNMTGPCGFSCNHCFLSQRCGGCRSVFNCCSYATVCEHGNCINFTCSRDRNIEGCWECNDLERCTKGFYSLGQEDSGACKGQAMFIRKYGLDAHQKLLDKLHEKFNFEKMQEIMPDELNGALKFLEETYKEIEK